MTAQFFISRSEDETGSFAAGLADLLRSGDVVFLKGPLGAGKTFFIKAAAKRLGISDPVTSPSFTMGQTYPGTTTVHHLDLYRLPSVSGEDLIDFEPFFSDDAVTFIEWPEVAEPYLDQPALIIEIEHMDRHSRRITVLCRTPELIDSLGGLLARAGN